MTAPVNLTNEELVEQFRIAKRNATLSTFHKERFNELKYEMNRRGLSQ